MIENWKDVVGYEGLYQVSSLGRVKRLETEYILNPSINKGYRRLTLYKNKQPYNITVHRLAAQAFIPNPNNLPFINHKDEDKLNNCVNNIEWCDGKYNSNYGTCRQKIGDANSIPVVQKTLDGEVVKIHKSLSQASRDLGINVSNICTCIHGRQKSCGGYLWEKTKAEDME